MRWQAIIVLAAIAISVLAPPAMPFPPGHDARAAIGTLDVCHSAAPALSANGDMPYLHESAGNPLFVALLVISRIENPPTKPFLIAFQEERPPKSLL